MDKKKLSLYGLIGIVITGLIVGLGLVFINSSSEEPPKPPQSSPSASPKTKPTVEEIELLYKNPQSEAGQQYGSYFANTAGFDQDNVVFLSLIANSTSSYITNTYFNPYFITNYWGKKDKYSESAIDKYLVPYVEPSLGEKFKTFLTDEETIPASFSPYIYDSQNQEVQENCYETWDVSACHGVDEPQITNMSFEALSETKFKTNVQFSVPVLIKKTDGGLEGDSVLQTRNYSVDFILNYHRPNDFSTEEPIMYIEEITIQSLDIQSADFSVELGG